MVEYSPAKKGVVPSRIDSLQPALAAYHFQMLHGIHILGWNCFSYSTVVKSFWDANWMVIHFHSEMAIISISNTLGSSWQIPMNYLGWPTASSLHSSCHDRCGVSWQDALREVTSLAARPVGYPSFEAGMFPKNHQKPMEQRFLQPKDHFTTKNMGISWDFSNRTGVWLWKMRKIAISATAKAVQMASLPTFKKPWTNVKWTVRPG